jgi:hypothetical protein
VVYRRALFWPHGGDAGGSCCGDHAARDEHSSYTKALLIWTYCSRWKSTRASPAVSKARKRSGVDGDPEQVHEAANSGGALCHCSQVGAEKDRGDRRRERGVGPVVEVPAALLAAVASVISYTICGVRDSQWLLPRAPLSPLGTL